MKWQKKTELHTVPEVVFLSPVVTLSDDWGLSVYTRVTALRTAAWSGPPALWAPRAEGRRSSLMTTSPSAPSSQHTWTPLRSSWSTRNTPAPAPTLSRCNIILLWCLLKERKWYRMKIETSERLILQSENTLGLCWLNIPIGLFYNVLIPSCLCRL